MRNHGYHHGCAYTSKESYAGGSYTSIENGREPPSGGQSTNVLYP